MTPPNIPKDHPDFREGKYGPEFRAWFPALGQYIWKRIDQLDDGQRRNCANAAELYFLNHAPGDGYWTRKEHAEMIQTASRWGLWGRGKESEGENEKP